MTKTIKKALDWFVVLFNKLIEFSLIGNMQRYITYVVYFIFIISPSIRLLVNILDNIKQKVDLINVLSIVSSIIGLVSFLLTSVVFFHKRRQYHTKSNNLKIEYIGEMQKLVNIFDKIGVDLTDEALSKFILGKITPTYIDLFEKYESIYPFGFKFLTDVSYFISKFNHFDKEKANFVSLVLFQTEYQFYTEFIQEFKKIDIEKNKYLLRNILTYYLYFLENDQIDISSIKVEELSYSPEKIDETYFDLIKSEDSKINNLIEDLENETLRNTILQHTIDNTYSVVGTSRKNQQLIYGPVVLIKNEENFQAWWDKLEKEAKEILESNYPKSSEDVSMFNLYNEVKKVDENLIKQPFSISLKQDPYIRPVLDHNPWSPVYLMDSDHLPAPYRNQPVKYIETVIKINATKHLNRLIREIKKIMPDLKSTKKELILDYELIPFSISDLHIRSRPDKSPKSIESLFLTNFIQSEERKDFVKAHVLQIKKVIERISPLSLIVNSCDKNTIRILIAHEIKLFKQLSLKKNGSIQFEGVHNILANEINKKKIIEVFFELVKNEKLSITKKTVSEVIDEIFKNAKILAKEI